MGFLLFWECNNLKRRNEPHAHLYCIPPASLVSLRRIGVDVFSYRKRHHYLTLVVDHDRRRVVWAAQGRSAETLKGFELLGSEACAQIELATIWQPVTSRQ